MVLLHGLAGSAQELSVTAAALADGYRVLVLDQRGHGHGHSTRRPVDISREAHVADVVALIDTVADGGPVSVVGQSMGAHTALLVAAWHPRVVRRLVMLEGGVGGGVPGLPAQLGRWFASWPAPFPSRRAAEEFLGGTPVAAAWADDLEERDGGYGPRSTRMCCRPPSRPSSMSRGGRSGRRRGRRRCSSRERTAAWTRRRFTGCWNCGQVPTTS